MTATIRLLEQSEIADVSYRADVDGIRAIAVVSVVVFHVLGPSVLPGGFVGVDIFFVISGFIITRMLLYEIAEKRFSLLRFYQRRIKRIVPALLLVIATTLVLGYRLQMPGDYLLTARSALAALAAVSNVFFYWNINYFSPDAGTMPLLHTWSLGVEEQFYLAWPLFLYALYHALRGRMHVIGVIVALLTVASFAYCLYLTSADSAAAYYLAPARAWQLSLGALVALSSVGKKRVLPAWTLPICSVTGLLGILASFFLIDAKMTYPGMAAALPTLGAGLLILGGQRSNQAVSVLLRLPPMQFLGRISYSLYLWHWPAIALFRHYSMGEEPTVTQGMALMFLAVLLSMLTYALVEQPARRSLMSLPTTYLSFALASVCLAAPTAWIVERGGMSERLPQQYQLMSGLDEMWRWKCRRNAKDTAFRDLNCWFGADWDSAGSHAVLWGDSNAEHYAPLLDAIGRKSGLAFVLIRSCPPFVDHEPLRFSRYGAAYSARCARVRTDAVNWLSAHPEVTFVVLASSWPGFESTLYASVPGDLRPDAVSDAMVAGLHKFLDEAKAPRRSFILLGEIPHLPQHIVNCAQSGHAGLWRRPCTPVGDFVVSDSLVRHRATLALLERTVEGRSEARVFPMVERLCTGITCRVREDREFLYRDEGHLRRNLPDEVRDSFIDRIGLESIFSR